MYSTFEPLGFAKGLPPTPGEKTSRWLSYLSEHGTSLVAEGADGFAGHVIVAESGEGEAEIAVFVHQEHRRRGLGQALTAAAVEYARGRGCRRLWATASPGNEAAIRMVKACGFRVVSERGAGDVELELRVGVG
jgi:ribosomal protein S18 acetylase RimI-like enzyme